MNVRQPSGSDGTAKPRQSSNANSEAMGSQADREKQIHAVQQQLHPWRKNAWAWFLMPCLVLCISGIFLVQIIRMNRELTSTNASYSSLTNELAALKNSGTQLISSNQNLVKLNDQLTVQHKNLKGDVDSLKKERNTLSISINSLKEEITILRNQTPGLEKELVRSKILAVVVQKISGAKESEIVRAVQVQLAADETSVKQILDELVAQKKVQRNPGTFNDTYHIISPSN